MSIEPPFPPMQLKHLTLFLIHGSQPIMKKGRNFSQWGNPYTPYCFSCVESLFLALRVEVKYLNSMERIQRYRNCVLAT